MLGGMSPPADRLADSATVWTRPRRGSRGPAPGLSLPDIAAAAVAIADRDGLDAVSMRAVAAALGTTAGSLYRYVRSRDELVDLMTDRVLLDRGPVQQLERWDDRVVALAAAQLAVHRRHPWLADALATPRVLGPHGLDWLEAFLAALAPVERPVAVKMELIALVTGVVTLFGRRAQGSGPRPLTPPQMFGAIDAQRHPTLAAALAGAPARPAADDLFERAVRALARGLLGDTAVASGR